MSYPTLFTTPGLRALAEEIDAERQRQLAKFGDQHHPDGTGRGGYIEQAETARTTCQMDAAITDGGPRWSLILLEEVYEALAESDPARLRTELLQVAAVCAAWIADLDSRTTEGARRVADETATEPQTPQRPDSLATPCSTCDHARNWHDTTRGICLVSTAPGDRCDCPGFTMGEQQTEADVAAAGARQDGAQP